jgi:poly(glycerol-phosphate) alpha-glucosyltransferase
VVISDVRHYDKLFEKLDSSVRKIHVWHEIAVNLPGKPGVNVQYKEMTDPKYALGDHDKIVVFTGDTKKEYATHFPHLADAFSVISHGTKTKDLAGDIERDKQLIVSIGRLQAGKNVAAQIEAFAIYHKKFPESRFEIYGDGPELDNLERLVDELGLTTSVKFCGYTTDVDATLQRAAMMVFSSDHESFGLTLLESLANGTPVASYDVRFGAKSMIVPGKNGVISRQNTPRSLANAMVALQALQLTPEEVQRSVSQQFNQDNIEDQWVTLISHEGETR